MTALPHLKGDQRLDTEPPEESPAHSRSAVHVTSLIAFHFGNAEVGIFLEDVFFF